MNVPIGFPRVKRLLRPVVHHLGLVTSIGREALALRLARLKTEVRLAGSPGRVAVVGCGVMGGDIVRAVRLLEGWTVVGLYDQRVEAATNLRSQLATEAVVHASLDTLLASRDDYDLVVVATTAAGHVPVALQALESGVRAILIEKPMATSLSEADQLVTMAERTGARVAVDHTRRWVPSGEGLKRLIASGVIGRPCAMHFTFGRGGFAMIGTHLFDFARFVFESDLVKLRAELDGVVRPSSRGPEFVDPTGRCEAYLANGVRVTMDLSDALPLQQAFCLIVGANGRLEIDERLGRLRLVGAGGRAWEDEYMWPSALVLGVARALFELRLGRRPRCAPPDGRAALEAAIGCHLSARDGGRWVTLPVNGEARRERYAFA